MTGGLLAILAALLVGATGALARDGGGPSGDLDRFGRWVDSKRYGEVWVPKVSLGWTPTNNGTYRQNDDGSWIWVSKDPFWSVTSVGGRWLKDRGEKWVWKPGLPPAPTGEGLGGGIVPIVGGFPGLPPGVAEARRTHYERTVRELAPISAPLPLPPLPSRRSSPY
ncbi:hypothetical protein BHAOGJBA_4171 [Methylobacterium hispanicum]|uniref:Uncharacterized protein n=1 Tax=Methylobacterium hispanicum TaxID=270350 RepID=A0AAV4ZRS8_9HYPH|nr:DUF6600 domain-containing protein [Methylobacterium hispanicum]GJD90629.1 hypothetical protein BHAOGJBA_4171 [Methylobacterium hispanicum]